MTYNQRQKLEGTGDVETVPCKFCNTPTTFTGTKLCNNCYEVEKRLYQFLQSTNGRLHVIRELLAAYEADARPAI